MSVGYRSLGVAPPAVTPKLGKDRPTKRSKKPPSGLLGSPTRMNDTSLGGTCSAASCDISSEEMMELCE
jgi:hypothetical protein